VGGNRKGMAVKTGAYYYIGPDNGVLSWGWKDHAAPEIRIIENKNLLRETVSTTFHGRDIFGPIAAHCAGGTPFDLLGPVTTEYTTLPFPQPETTGRTIISPLLSIDRFGNCITAITGVSISSGESVTLTVHINGKEFAVRKKKFYGEVNPGEPLCYTGSLGFLEIAVNQGNAARIFGVSAEDTIEIDLP
jgi:S-adenosyl-L-methionine hydrolase (adenosine-forming)